MSRITMAFDGHFCISCHSWMIILIISIKSRRPGSFKMSLNFFRLAEINGPTYFNKEPTLSNLTRRLLGQVKFKFISWFHFFSKILTHRETHVQIFKYSLNEIHISSFGLFSRTLGTCWSTSSNRGQKRSVRFDGLPHIYYTVTVNFCGSD